MPILRAMIEIVLKVVFANGLATSGSWKSHDHSTGISAGMRRPWNAWIIATFSDIESDGGLRVSEERRVVSCIQDISSTN